MRFTEHEMTVAVAGAAKTVFAAQRSRGRNKLSGQAAVDAAWDEMDRYQRFVLLDSVGTQILPALIALPDVTVESGTPPTFTAAQVNQAVEETLGEAGGKLRRKVQVVATVALVQAALGSLPPRSDPDALIVPDHL